ncbi:MAG: hypothetical protein ABSF90_20095 [Syntrophobacteraceae bacterium]|jgi:hypothetical protein
MDRKLLSLPVFTIALAVAFVFWAPGGSMAAGSSYHPGYNESANTFEDNDWAGTRAETTHDRETDRSVQPPPYFQSYGLQGDWRGQH